MLLSTPLAVVGDEAAGCPHGGYCSCFTHLCSQCSPHTEVARNLAWSMVLSALIGQRQRRSHRVHWCSIDTPTRNERIL
eukprot:3647442-Amphidinium_carterae.1